MIQKYIVIDNRCYCVLTVAANSLFGSPNDSDSVESQENGDSLKPKPPPMQKRSTGGGGLFDEEDEEEDDDFFSGKTLKKPSPSKCCIVSIASRQTVP